MQRHPEEDALAEAEEAYLTARPAADSVSAGEWGLRALLILLVVDIFIVAPIAQGGTSVVQPVVHSIVLVSGIAIASQSRWTVLALVGVLGVASLVTHWTYHDHPTIVLQRADTALSLTFTAIVTSVTLLQVVRAGPITAHRIEGAVAAYLLVAYAWALAYQLVELSDPSSFSFPAAAVPQTLRFHLLYFSVTNSHERQLWRHHAARSRRPLLGRARGRDRPALPRAPAVAPRIDGSVLPKPVGC